MHQTEIVFFADEAGNAPLLKCFDTWPAKVVNKCWVRIQRLKEMRYELRRPEADYLRDGVYELRIRHLNTNYRLLYFFHENKAVLFTGLLKEREIPPKEINLAIQAKFDYMESPRKHTFEEDSYEG